jgi:hypothetical protein
MSESDEPQRHVNYLQEPRYKMRSAVNSASDCRRSCAPAGEMQTPCRESCCSSGQEVGRSAAIKLQSSSDRGVVITQRVA